MTYSQALEYIHSFRPFVPNPELDRLLPLLNALGNPQDQLKFIHVAGTNGKGSIVTMCAKILTLSGYRCGVFTSPYVVDFRERFQVDGEMISQQELAALVEALRPILEEMKTRNQFVNEFDVVTAIGFLYFLSKGCNIVCLEVGLGGIHDSTNVIKTPLAEIITSISLDHTRVLGDTIEEIAAKKAGIIKPNSDCVCYPRQHLDAIAVLMEQCAKTGSRLHLANPNQVQITRSDLTGSAFFYAGKSYEISLVGAHQVYNAVTVIQTMELLRQKGFVLPGSAITEGLKETRFSARFQILRQNPVVVVDGAHNPEGLQALSQTLQMIQQKKTLIVGMMADKDYGHSLQAVCRQADEVICVPIQNPRAVRPELLAELAEGVCPSVSVIRNLSEAFQTALDRSGEQDYIIVCGSFFLAGEMIPIIKNRL